MPSALSTFRDNTQIFSLNTRIPGSSPGGSAVKNPPANEGDAGLIPGLGSSPREGNGSSASILAWENPWIEDPDGLYYSPGGHKELDMT